MLELQRRSTLSVVRTRQACTKSKLRCQSYPLLNLTIRKPAQSNYQRTRSSPRLLHLPFNQSSSPPRQSPSSPHHNLDLRTPAKHSRCSPPQRGDIRATAAWRAGASKSPTYRVIPTMGRRRESFRYHSSDLHTVGEMMYRRL